jgi:hypothetical protein
MGSQAALREALGRNDIEVRFGDGKQYVTMDDKTVELSASASPAEVAQALDLSKPPVPAPSPALIPQVQILTPMTSAQAAAPAKPVKTVPAPGSFAASIRAIVNEARDGLQQARSDCVAQVREAVGELQAVTAQTKQVGSSMVKSIKDETAAALAELGQISNMPPEDAQ